MANKAGRKPQGSSRKVPVTWQLPAEIIALVSAYSKAMNCSKQVAVEKLIVEGIKSFNRESS